MKLINKQTVIAVLLTAVLFFGLGSFSTKETKAASDQCECTQPDLICDVHEANDIHSIPSLYCGKPAVTIVNAICKTCGKRSAMFLESENIPMEHTYVIFRNSDTGECFEYCVNCLDFRFIEQPTEPETEEPTEPETDHVHNYNKKGKCKICGQMMP